MKNRTVSIPVGMMTKKFCCCKCGERLSRKSRTWTVRPGDPDYRKHSKIGRMHVIGEVEVTEYDFQCPYQIRRTVCPSKDLDWVDSFSPKQR